MGILKADRGAWRLQGSLEATNVLVKTPHLPGLFFSDQAWARRFYHQRRETVNYMEGVQLS